ncbi:hypothetical protein GmRootA79_16100 [Acidovorax sp. A79]|uniref:carbohydrate-binding protein n=1 Tax=Acidovorax sp. A79 TaxID=3056107 RepID=UPI0034E88587
MAEGFLILRPMEVTEATLVSSTVPETDEAVYNPATPYPVKALVMWKHSVYENTLADNTGNAPDLNPDKWVRVRATNRWRLFDGTNSSRTAQANTMSYVFAPGISIRMVAALNLVACSAIRVRLIDPVRGTVYDVTKAPGRRPVRSDPWEWYFGEWTRGLGLSLFENLPAYPLAQLRVDLTGGEGLAIGLLMYGQPRRFGLGVLRGGKVNRRVYSRREENQFGDIELLKRPSAKEGSHEVLIKNQEVDEVLEYLDTIDASICLFVAARSFSATVIFGIFTDASVLLQHRNHSLLQLEMLGAI